MRFTIVVEEGSPKVFACDDGVTSAAECTAILEGETYPLLPFAGEVGVVFDIGAGCGASSVYFARRYPAAQIHAFESGTEPRAYLERNADGYANVHLHPLELDAAAAAADVPKIELLKIDVGGRELDILAGLASFLPTVKVLYVYYGSRRARREIDRILDTTHELYLSEAFLDLGECIYVRKDLADLDAATDRLRELFTSRLAAAVR